GRFLDLLLGEIDDIAAALGIVGQRLPGQRIMFAAEPEQAAERQHGIARLARDLVDHEALDRAEPLALPVIDRGPFHAIRSDEGVALAGWGFHASLLMRIARP